MNLTSLIACKIISICIAVVGIFGNVLVCHVIVRLKAMKTSINYIILNLAILDAIACIFAIPYVTILDNQGIFGESVLLQAYTYRSNLAHGICKVGWLFWLPFIASPLMLMIMAYERFKAITDPLSRLDGTVTKARLKWMLPLAWLMGLISTISKMIGIQYDSQTNSCSNADAPPWYKHKILVICYVITQFIVPSTAILIFYGRVIFSLRKQDITLGSQAAAERARHKARKKVMWVTVAVTVVFYVLCGIPYALYTLLVLYEKPIFDALDINVLLLTLNSTFNPFAYFFFMQSFRDGFKQVFMKRRILTPSNSGLEMVGRFQNSLVIKNETVNNA